MYIEIDMYCTSVDFSTRISLGGSISLSYRMQRRRRGLDEDEDDDEDEERHQVRI